MVVVKNCPEEAQDALDRDNFLEPTEHKEKPWDIGFIHPAMNEINRFHRVMNQFLMGCS
jgi:hypothetical protein